MLSLCNVCHGICTRLCCNDVGGSATAYCSTGCQRADWPEHKKVCTNPNNGIYDIRPIPGAGYNQGVVAVKNIPKGTVIMQELHTQHYSSRWLNHSCNPNAHRSVRDVNGYVYVVAVRDIPAGDEVTITYIHTNYFSKTRRTADLLAKYKFTCQCSVCVRDDPAIEEVREIYESVLDNGVSDTEELVDEFIQMLGLVAVITNSKDIEPINMAAYYVFANYIKKLILETSNVDSFTITRMLTRSVHIAEALQYTNCALYTQHKELLRTLLARNLPA